jgi:hypothetical protein
VVSGGQSGVDRAALDAALAAGLAVGGWCPRGRWAEDGAIDRRYPLRPAPSVRPCCRTLLNLRDSDGTLVLARGRPRGGTALTMRAAGRGRPRLLLDPTAPGALRRARWWLLRHAITRLNVGGPRASEDPGIYDLARDFLAALFQSVPHSR